MFRLLIHPDLQVINEADDGYAARYSNLRFIVSIGRELDGNDWLHTSVSRDDGKMPSYDDLMTLKRLCVGEHRTALQVFPPTKKHIDIASKVGVEVLHLWSCLDKDVVPDFTRGGDTI